MAGFQVNGDSLRAVADTLQTLVADLDPVAFCPADFTHGLGGDHLADQLWLFDDQWGHAADRIKADVHALSAHLRQAIEHYTEVDRRIAHHASGGVGDARPSHGAGDHGHGGDGHGDSGHGRTAIDSGAGPQRWHPVHAPHPDPIARG
jgi:hypothetical protein